MSVLERCRGREKERRRKWIGLKLRLRFDDYDGALETNESFRCARKQKS